MCEQFPRTRNTFSEMYWRQVDANCYCTDVDGMVLTFVSVYVKNFQSVLPALYEQI